MSTKCSISFGKDHHLYQESYEQDHVWIQLNDVTEFKISKNELDDKIFLRVAIPVAAWRQMTKDWAESSWCKNPDQGGRRTNIVNDFSFMKQLKDLAKNQSEL